MSFVRLGQHDGYTAWPQGEKQH